jgi:hypothetical protein
VSCQRQIWQPQCMPRLPSRVSLAASRLNHPLNHSHYWPPAASCRPGRPFLDVTRGTDREFKHAFIGVMKS